MGTCDSNYIYCAHVDVRGFMEAPPEPTLNKMANPEGDGCRNQLSCIARARAKGGRARLLWGKGAPTAIKGTTNQRRQCHLKS
eukprot:9497753-Pyramimonas_sp.AAC.1